MKGRGKGFRVRMGIFAAVAAAVLGISAVTLLPLREHKSNSQQDKTVYYFYDEECAGCDRQGEFIELFYDRLSGVFLPEDFHIQCINLFSEGEQLWEETCDRLKIPEERRTTPMVVAGYAFATGEENIRSRLRELTCELCGIPDTGTIRYYYRPDCKDCMRIRELVEEQFEANPGLSVIRINTNDPAEKEAFKEKLGQWEVPEDKCQVPFLDNGKDYLSGDLEIEEKMVDFLRESMPVQ